jgi:hypothetical protein
MSVRALLWTFLVCMLTLSGPIAHAKRAGSSHSRNSHSSGSHEHYVAPHNKGGSQVAGHYQSNPNGTKGDNWSARGNVNPHTGEAGKHKDTGSNERPHIVQVEANIHLARRETQHSPGSTAKVTEWPEAIERRLLRESSAIPTGRSTARLQRRTRSSEAIRAPQRESQVAHALVTSLTTYCR